MAEPREIPLTETERSAIASLLAPGFFMALAETSGYDRIGDREGPGAATRAIKRRPEYRLDSLHPGLQRHFCQCLRTARIHAVGGAGCWGDPERPDPALQRRTDSRMRVPA